MAGINREEKRKSIGKLTVDLDTSDAVTALKALQRTARETTKVLREVEAVRKESTYTDGAGRKWRAEWTQIDGDVSDIKQRLVSVDLSELSTQEIADELARRANVSDYDVTSNDRAVFKYRSDDNTEGVNFPFRGPAKVLVVNCD
jgi:hypothetical protein